MLNLDHNQDHRADTNKMLRYSLPSPRIPLNEIPDFFCWTKMGVEAGQSLQAIVRRKELERQLGGGSFVWGIGNSLGSSLHEFGKANGEIPLLFSPIQSKPRAVDTNPGKLILWLDYFDNLGKIRPLPKHTLVTSRGLDGAPESKKRHYALFCHSETSLLEELNLVVDFHQLQNANSLKPLGFSQITAFVRHVSNISRETEARRIYDVPFRANLINPFCVRLTNGVEIPADFAFQLEEITNNASLSEWEHFVEQVRRWVLQKAHRTVQ
ncbi:MAG: hypothetical protein D9V46_01600 [Deltaproteobacteria bacterium]|uniref:hypothetical protein n=1 Tax=Hydrosulfovibrio ferrireducens TaxID=2934181 RepID=UPI00121C0610|nr:MAG: hypothetical protein D9V46_01600 [Deltaproteobacteria bacterium]